MLDQNTDRMWYVIGAVLIRAAIIFGMNTLMPEAFAGVSDNFGDVLHNASVSIENIVYNGPIKLSVNRGQTNHDGSVDVKVFADSEHGVSSIRLIDGPSSAREHKMLHLDGVDDYVDMFYDFGEASAFTIGAVVNNTQNNEFLINHHAQGGWQMLNSTVMKTDGIGRWQGEPVYDDDWYAQHSLHHKNVTSHISITWDGETLNRYIDGELVGSEDVSGTFNLTTVHIGSRIAWSTKEINAYSSGNISELYVMKDNALSESAISDIHTNGFSGSGAGLVLHYDLNQTSGDIITDLSGNGKHGTIHGGRLIPVFNLTENGDYTFEVTDNEGNTREQTVSIRKVRGD